ncbi:MAG TPA: alpha/beta hydrolase [Rhizomicrobium sp.]|jgi:pimeloyl-ACP methyl ester carboxylesterase|nr:alpha/beta hydrolase [Rhizomicrobium sp.]
MRIVLRLLKWAGLAVLALVSAGLLYQQIGALIDERTVPQAGRMVEVAGHGVHVTCMGAGARTLVLDAGLGAASFEWYRLQPALAKAARVCAFDRPGQGASDAVAHAYDGVTAADELHALLAPAGIAAPFVYVGHSLGANFAQIYASRYPHDLAALVLIEPGVPADVLEDFHGSRADALALPATCGGLCIAGWIAGALGVTRFVVNHVHTGTASFDGDQAAIARYRADAARTAMAGASAAYYAALPKIMVQVEDAGRPGPLPVLVFASAIAPPPDDGDTPASMAAWRRRQLAWFASLAAGSSHGEGPITIPGSTHASLVMGRPAAATAAAIAAFLAKLPAPALHPGASSAASNVGESAARRPNRRNLP